ncbi:putative bifunctional diguanylate cyclase/phosphodiesterase [Sphingomonas sp. S2-65]|uniref:putative bifunctional diguanylate cyclase/phosphodiesterase n=1 Tax=Sphingomonas sp. S2-65 TaxID=2903960 RepID=UPI001F23A5DA|nr:EAL domain-containing protein [Sphingomonas sp. S2-65]UYY58823.1 EAL domain-containing protein [Sphingomonas sp. S2-65]
MMRRLLSAFHPFETGSSEILLEQFRVLRNQVPLMYALMLVDAAFLSFASHGSVSMAWSVGVPALLGILCAVRTLFWLRRRGFEPQPEKIRRYLLSTTLVAAVLSLGFGGWGMFLYAEADLLRRACIALYIFIGTICCCYCLQSLPRAGYLVLLCGAAPVTVYMIFSESWFLRGLGMNMVLVSVVVVRMLRTNFAGFLEVLTSRIDMAMEQRRARGAEQRAYQLAYHDPLTGLPNRRALAEALGARLHARHPDGAFGLLIVDLDRFKAVNDVHGHPIGDQLLHDVADRLGDIVNGVGQSYRLGGDEFAIVLEGGSDSVCRVAKAIVQRLAQPFAAGERTHHIGASVGTALFPEDGNDRETLMRRGDIALYKAKQSGRGRHCAFEASLDAEIRRRAVIESDMREAIACDAFVPHYQPIVDLGSGVVVGYELLARWPRPRGAEIGPDQFIPIAEECGLIDELMLGLLTRAFRETRDWGMMIAVNVSPNQLRDAWFSQKMLATLSREQFPARNLTVEITENALITDAASVRETILSLKDQGINLALDDFGTGYSSLQHLQMLPFDKIKIDRSFVTTMDHDAKALRLVDAIVALARRLDLPVVAEGIESAATADALAALGCTYGQGYHFGHPMAADEVEAVWHRLSCRSDLSAPSRLRAG